MKIFKAIMSVILTIVVSVLLIAIAVIGVAKNTVFSRKYVVEKASKTQIYDNIKITIDESIKKLIGEDYSQIPILEEFSSVENIKVMTETYIVYLYEYSSFLPSAESVKIILNNSIDKIAKKEEMTISDEQKNKINKLIDDIANSYGEISKNVESIDNFPIDFKNMVKFINIIFKVSIEILIAMMALMIIFNLSTILDGIKFLASGAIVSGMVLIGMNVTLNKFNLKRLGVDGNITDVFQSILNDVAQMFRSTGIVYIIISLLIITICVAIPQIKKRKNQSKIISTNK